MGNYFAIVHKEASNDFVLSFPDFHGCITAGQDIDEDKEMAQDALALHIQGMLEDGNVQIHIPVHAAQNQLDTTSPDHSA